MSLSMLGRALVMLIALRMILAPTAAAAQPPLAGVITLLRGSVTVTRTSAPDPLPLQLRDGIFAEDTIATAEDGVARILLGGKAIVTMRERSTVQILEEASTSTIVVREGKVAIAVARELTKTGELIEVRTPTALVTTRGAVLIIEATTERSTFTVIRGLVDVTRVDSLGTRFVGPRVMLRANQEVTIPTPGLLRPRSVNARAIERLAGEFDADAIIGVGDSTPAPGKYPPAPASKRLR